jgi:hypothetical protein
MTGTDASLFDELPQGAMRLMIGGGRATPL